MSAEVLEQGRPPAEEFLRGLLGLIPIGLLAFAYLRGEFDPFLVQMGFAPMTWTQCAVDLFGQALCGDQLRDFCLENFRTWNAEVCEPYLVEAITANPGSPPPPPTY